MIVQGSNGRARQHLRLVRGGNEPVEDAAVENARLDREDLDTQGSALWHELPRRFQIKTERRGGAVAWLSLFGRLDLRSAGVLVRELLGVEGDVRRVIVDARGLRFMDAVGVHVLVHAGQRAERGGWDLMVIGGSKPIDRLVRFPAIARGLKLLDAEGVLA